MRIAMVAYDDSDAKGILIITKTNGQKQKGRVWNQPDWNSSQYGEPMESWFTKAFVVEIFAWPHDRVVGIIRVQHPIVAVVWNGTAEPSGGKDDAQFSLPFQRFYEPGRTVDHVETFPTDKNG